MIKINFSESPSSIIINGINTKYINCTRHATLDYLAYKGIEDKLHFVIKPVEFKYHDISSNNIFNYNNTLRLNGVSVDKLYVDTEEDLFCLCLKELKKDNPLFVWMDWFYIEGSRFYNKIHSDPHNALIVGIDEETKSLCLKDRWLSNQGSFVEEDKWIQIRDMKPAIVNFCSRSFVQTFSVLDKSKILYDGELTNYIMTESIENMIGSRNEIDDMKRFLSDLSEKNDTIIPKQIGTELLVNYVCDRYLFAVFLDNKIIDKGLSAMFIEQAIAWWKAVAVLWSRQPDLYEMLFVMKSFIYTEEMLFEKLKSFV